MHWSSPYEPTSPLSGPLTLALLTAFALTTVSCATATPPPATPPQLVMPAKAAENCKLSTLPAHPTQADLEEGYARRGDALVLCDGLRQLAVMVHAEEHRLEAEWAKLRAERNRPWWQFWKPRGDHSF
jgi:hypothetical protein